MRSAVEAEPVMPGRRLPHWRFLLQLEADGVRNAAIAATYGVSPAAVSQAMARARRRAAAIHGIIQTPEN
ncbi:hypothetical protein IHQ68_04430 [Chelatococcus sambhunathii]|uniref:Sigma-70, region 4 n=1 Tax=Chelatococcus sambhunathii TaxID=363953 RepID=A0ABU1DCP9_9HYPH|nr:hypothetical protein [Chelatococcus sambhunathii]MDR4305872.1 hypothetical protein [Chelatococcus sambhunathii]